MTRQHGVHPLIPRFVRMFSVPIVLFWIGLVAVLTLAVPSLEKVSQDHTVSLAPADAPSMQAMKRIGKDFQEFDSNSTAMILLESDQPLGPEAHHYYDGLIQKLRDDPKHVEHIQDFWGDPLTAAGSQSADGKAAYVQVYLAGNQGESPGQRVGRRRPEDRQRQSAAAGAQGLRHRPDGIEPRPAQRRRRGGQDGRGSHHRRHLRDAAAGLPLHHHDDPRAADGVPRTHRGQRRHRVPGQHRTHRPVDVRGQPAGDPGHRRGHRLCDLPDRALPRGAVGRRGPRNRLLHDVSRHRARDPGLGPDHRRRDVLPALHPHAVLQVAGLPAGHRHARRGVRGADPGRRGDRHRQPVRPVRARNAR